MRLFFAILSITALFSCAPRPHTLARLEDALPASDRLAGQMKPVLAHIWQEQAAAFAWPAHPVRDSAAYRDSTVFSRTAILAGQHMRAMYEKGQFTASEKKREQIRQSTWQQ